MGGMDMSRLEECTVRKEGIHAQYQQEIIATQLCYESALAPDGGLVQEDYERCIRKCSDLHVCHYANHRFDLLVALMFSRDVSGHSQLNSASHQQTLQRVRDCMDSRIGVRAQRTLTVLGVTTVMLLLWILQVIMRA